MKTIKEIEHLESKYAMDKVFSEKEIAEENFHLGRKCEIERIRKLIDEMPDDLEGWKEELKSRINGK